ncbi:MAG: molybdopterin-dependent oxidoreductase, partial [Anaerolineaceae bacterium]|nr:molybdopterin-dependent oxidoreductase [Anaerolineaceae bacterium]
NAAEKGDIRCLYVIGEDPLTSDPDTNHVKKALEKTEFLIIQDLFFTNTSVYADVVFPAASFAEKEGTFTNTERRIQRVRKAVSSPGEAKEDSWIIANFAKRIIAKSQTKPTETSIYCSWDYEKPINIMNEISALSPIYGGVTYERIEKGENLHWPILNESHPGTPILHVGKFSRGLGKFAAVDHMPPDEQANEEYPLILTTGRVIYHWHGGEMTHRARNLLKMYPESLVEISPEDAKKYGVKNDQLIKVFSRRGEIIAKALITDRISEGLIFATFHFAENTANFLTNPALDPVAKIPELKIAAVRIEV